MKKFLFSLFVLISVQALAVTPDPLTVGVGFTVQFTGGGSVTMNVTGDPGYIVTQASTGSLTESPLNFAWFRPRQVYTANVSGSNAPTYAASFTAPDGYEVYINGVLGDLYPGTGSTGSFPGIPFTVEVRPVGDSSRADAGSFSGIKVGKAITWDVGLGGLRNGRSAGRISFNELDLSTKVPTNRARLFYSAPANDTQINVIKDGSSNLRQVMTPQTLVDITDVNGTNPDLGYIMAFYAPSQWGPLAGGVYTFTGAPWRTIKVWPGTAGHLTITENEGGGLSGSGGVTRQSDLTLTSGTLASSVYLWTLQEGSGTAYIRTTTNQSTLPAGGGRDEVVTVYTGAATTTPIKRTKYHYETFVWGEEVTTMVADPDTAALPTTYDYYTSNATSADYGNYHRVKSVKGPTGNWTAYSYYGDFNRRGSLFQEFHPYLDSPAPVTLDPTHGRVITYDYVADYNGRGNIVSHRDERIENVPTALTTVDVHSTSVNVQPVLTRVSSDYRDASNSQPSSIYDFYWDSTVNVDLRNLPAMRQSSASVVDSYAYYLGSYNTATNTWANTGSTHWRSICVHGDAAALGDVDIGSYDGKNMFGSRLIFNQSTLDITIQDAAGNVLRKETQVCSGGSGSSPVFTPLTWQNFTYDGAGRLTQVAASNGAITTYTYTNGQLTGTNTDGIVMAYTYDELGRTKTSKKVGMTASSPYLAQVDILTTNTYDGANNLTQSVTAGGSLTLTQSAVYDLAGRLTSSTAPGSFTTSYVYTFGGRSVTATLPGGATKITENFTDGSLKQVTGTGVVGDYYSYSVNGSGQQVTQHKLSSIASPYTITSTADWLGRTVSESRPSWTGTPFVKTWRYDNSGLLQESSQTGESNTLYQYTALGVLYRTGLAGGSLNSLDPWNSERWNETNVNYYNGGGGDWFLQTQKVTYATAANPTPTTVSTTYERVANFAGNMRAQTQFYDIHGNFSAVTVTTNPTTNITIKDTLVGDSNIHGYDTYRNGLLQSSSDTVNVTMTYTYDTLGRQNGSTDPRTGTTTTIYKTGSSLINYIQDPASVKTATYTYDAAGRVATVTNAGSKVARYEYNTRDQKIHQWGDTEDPVEFLYDNYGRQMQMNTYRGATGYSTATTWAAITLGSADATTWSYDEATGLLSTKTDAAGKSTTYTYTQAGQVATRTWARGPVTSYAYSPINGLLTGVSYSDGTPGVTYTYNRLESPATVTDFTGTHTFTYDLAGTLELKSEDLPSFLGSGRRLTYNYDTTTSGAKGRLTFRGLGTAASTSADQYQDFAYQADGRLNYTGAYAAGYTGYGFGIGYQTNSHLVNQIATTTGGYQDLRTFEPKHDWVTSRVTNVSSALKASFVYTQDTWGRITKVTKTGEVFNRYGDTVQGLDTTVSYDNRSQVTGEITKLGGTTTTLSPRSNDSYSYDSFGNRINYFHLHTTTNTINNLNQYTSQVVPGWTDIYGAAAAAATVTVNGSTSGVTRAGPYFAKNAAMTNTSGPVLSTFTISDGTTTTPWSAFLVGTPQTMTYDFDGNLTGDGRYTYTYDAEDRLRTVTTTSAVASAGLPFNRWTFSYDYLGRRVKKLQETWSGSAWGSPVEKRFIYDSWNLIAETDASAAITKNFFWGLDLSGTAQGAGGVGGLLMTEEGGNSYWPAYDAMGNIHGLIKASDGSLAAAYEYDAFGNTIRESGSYSASNPFRFSTKYTDIETSLVYYGQRFYSSSLGRFINKDPIEESGGLNLYGFCGNNGVNGYDLLGMDHYEKRWITDFPGWDQVDSEGHVISHPGTGHYETVYVFDTPFVAKDNNPNPGWSPPLSDPTNGKGYIPYDFPTYTPSGGGNSGGGGGGGNAPGSGLNGQDANGNGGSAVTLPKYIFTEKAPNSTHPRSDILGTRAGEAAIRAIALDPSNMNAWFDLLAAGFSMPGVGNNLGVMKVGTAATKLTQSEASALSKLKNILTKGIKPGPKGDISGAVADMVGGPIPKPGGGVWDHAQDLGGMLRGLRNNIDKLANTTDPAAIAVRQQAQQMINEIEAAIKGNGI